MHVNGTNGEILRLSITPDAGTQQEFGLGFATGPNTNPAAQITVSEFDASDSRVDMLFYTRGTNSDIAPTERMRITSSGLVGIGSTNPQSQLDVNGAILATGATSQTYIDNGVITTNRPDGMYLIQSANSPLLFYTNNTVRMLITAAGNVGIGTTNPTTALTVNGTVTATAFSGNGASVTNVNATTLDSLDSTQFLRSDANDTMTGNLTITGNLLVKDGGHTASTSLDWVKTADLGYHDYFSHLFTGTGFQKWSSSAWGNWFYWASGSSAGEVLTHRIYSNGDTPTQNKIDIWNGTAWNRVLTVADEGSGNGLDADTIDGIDSGSFLRSDADDTATGTIYLSDPYNRINTGNTSNTSTADTNGLYLHTAGYLDGRYTTRFRKRDEGGGVPLYVDNSANTANVFTQVARFGSYTGNIHEFEVFGNTGINGNIYLTGTPTTTNQARTIHFTGFDKETVGDVSDAAYIQHTTNQLGHTGSVLVISSLNDAQDGIAFQTNGSSPLKHNSKNIPRIGVSDSAPGATNIVGDLWWDSDQGSLHIYYGSAWVEVNPYLGTTANPQFNSLGVGTAASGTTGEIRATNDVTAYYSDARLKDFEGTIDNAVDKVKQLNGYYFRENKLARNLGYNNPNRQVGVSAQEVQTILPEVVVAAPISDEYLTVKYEKMVPLLIEAIKEQQTMIDELREEIKKLKGDV